jgi:hypothetical protein
VGQEAVVDPITGEADYQVDVLHGTNSVPCEWALGPIGQDGGFGPEKSQVLWRNFCAIVLVGNCKETMYPIWDTVFQRERLCA